MRILTALALFSLTSYAAVDSRMSSTRDLMVSPFCLTCASPTAGGPFPAAILVHGGGFDEGSKSTNVQPVV